MKFSNETILISIDSLLEEKLRIINGEKVMFDFKLAELLQVSTTDLIREVRTKKKSPPFAFLKISLMPTHIWHIAFCPSFSPLHLERGRE